MIVVIDEEKCKKITVVEDTQCTEE